VKEKDRKRNCPAAPCQEPGSPAAAGVLRPASAGVGVGVGENSARGRGADGAAADSKSMQLKELCCLLRL